MIRKICVVVTARPSYSRIRSALRAIADRRDLELQLVVAASALLDRYGNAVQAIEHDGFHIAQRVYLMLEGENLVTSAKSTGIGLSELATVFDNLAPDAVVTVADRYETLATAVAASYMNIPVVHVQGGEVTGSIDEKVRHAVTKLSNLHLVSTALARERVIRLGEREDTIFVTGCPSIDIAAEVAASPDMDFDPFAKYGGVGPPADLSKGYLVVMQHPVTTEYDQARAQVDETLYAVKDFGLPVLWFWPNPDAGSDGTSKGIRMFREREKPENFHLFRNMYPEDFLRLLVHATAIAGNSSVAIRECSYLGVPAVNIGSRQEGRERGANVIDVDHDRDRIAAALREHGRRGRPAPDHLYGDGKAGGRIAECVATAELSIEKRLTY
ncbi:MAG: UDP-N-acetyl-D-glucosamine 2-epimerase, UDP-hydrolysing [Acidobacteria bacterium RIFCSPLOWO2_12_FULL_67_14]|nr:MAG: UDP-N-acetyl-D-glucosamine 2-epimerase, UDP-hydrolysing [Acidobacteria bacterium RIFCSPLOWO2_02_FULL_67_21]OFW36143.1 MAG: UDP-N-acetyl-D-glucosamine 2-epimerase, UDP-hydrolysing [Acidobacteria bacterium RIFCSPLOWO2_12_FULL_67_14]